MHILVRQAKIPISLGLVAVDDLIGLSEVGRRELDVSSFEILESASGFPASA